MADIAENQVGPDYAAIKSKQQVAWSDGDYSIVGVTLQIVGESLCEAMDVRPGQRLIDVAAGNGNCSLAAARRFCEVTSTDYVQDLLRAAAPVPKPSGCRSSSSWPTPRRYRSPTPPSTQ